MKLLAYKGTFLGSKLLAELRDAGVPASWEEESEAGTVTRGLVVQVVEPTIVVAAKLDEEGSPVLDGAGLPVCVYLADGAEVAAPKGAPDPAEPGQQLPASGSATVEIGVPDDTDEKLVAKIVKAHDPTPPSTEPTREQQAAAILRDAAKSVDEKWAAVADLFDPRSG